MAGAAHNPTVSRHNRQMCESERKLGHRRAMLEVDDLAGTFIVFLLKCRSWTHVKRARPVAAGELKRTHDCKLPPLWVNPNHQDLAAVVRLGTAILPNLGVRRTGAG